jgi:WD repeat-containing protein 26
LATGSKDGCLIIWDVDPITYKLTLNKSYEDHSCGVGWVSWSPDDKYLIVCGSDESSDLWIWDVEVNIHCCILLFFAVFQLKSKFAIFIQE